MKKTFRVIKRKGIINILQSQFFLSEARQLGAPVCVLLSVLIESKLIGFNAQQRHWKDGLEAMSECRR